MRCDVSLRRRLAHVVAVCLFVSLAGACSSISQRFDGNPLANPFKSDQELTGAVASAGHASGGEGQVRRETLSSPSGSQGGPQDSRPMLQAGQPDPVVGKADGWTAHGGTAVIVGNADTLQNISNRYGVPPAAILATNRLKSARDVKPGDRIIIPVYGGGGAPGRKTAHSAGGRETGEGQAKFRLVTGPAPARGLDRPGRPVGKSAAGDKAKADAKAKTAKGSVDHKAKADLKAKAGQSAETEKAAAAKTKAVPEQRTAKATGGADKAEKPADKPADNGKASDPPSTSSVAKRDGSEAVTFRWPAHGRVISGFGAKGGNEGINIAVPEGTPVKAAEGGTVAYAGNELKGYGNLVLVKHDNGWVSAYANNGEILVKRGDKVRRGQPIAKSGQSGNVSSPQLHFELRKGATPVDPLPHLNGS